MNDVCGYKYETNRVYSGDTAVQVGSPLYWDVMWCILVLSCRHFSSSYRSRLHDSGLKPRRLDR